MYEPTEKARRHRVGLERQAMLRIPYAEHHRDWYSALPAKDYSGLVWQASFQENVPKPLINAVPFQD